MSCYNCCGCCYEEEDDHRIEHSGLSSSYSRASSTYNNTDNSSNSDNSLRIASGISAFLSLIIVSVAIGTGEWLFTEEKLPKAFASNASAEPDSKVTYSGLWRVCVATTSHIQYECSSIDYFPNEEYSPDPSDSTMAIPYAVTKSAMFFFIATLLLVVAEVCYFAAHVSRPRHQLCVFVAGVVFTICGLLMLVGMIMYISVFKAEVGSKLRPRSSFQGPPFTYRYGFSFLLYVSGFITTEVAGTSAIFLYISWHQRDFGKRELSQKNCEDVYHLSNHVHQQNFHPSHSHNTHSSFLCERHQKRYFFSRDSVDQVDFDEFLPPPPSLDYHEYPRQFPRDLTTQTISTTADVLNDEYGSNLQHEFVTFDFETPFPPAPPVKGSSEWPLEAFRRTTPV
ncbi:voltage-dependent calcium channel gamma-4 subunit [Microplitis demolitor]|uniref:voltage-dependent calcium channel gamma-4 subunit n=1 Tax=Microplitis demolitor TaxID=69319 RepID=UPI0004CCB65E|nr:voltage-dependent calcium channel gamma-4 subunit [Microplitis demolitor]XP_008556043.1 voltage-dependent calcium channel gamma-4 subunit [Microplitis demolitor]XP_053596672.1 voltage-dependent calcium channel gamma-4 subunit [Microplitis demolitor]